MFYDLYVTNLLKIQEPWTVIVIYSSVGFKDISMLMSLNVSCVSSIH